MMAGHAALLSGPSPSDGPCHHAVTVSPVRISPTTRPTSARRALTSSAVCPPTTQWLGAVTAATANPTEETHAGEAETWLPPGSAWFVNGLPEQGLDREAVVVKIGDQVVQERDAVSPRPGVRLDQEDTRAGDLELGVRASPVDPQAVEDLRDRAPKLTVSTLISVPATYCSHRKPRRLGSRRRYVLRGRRGRAAGTR